ncbi:DinB family protein [Danxiaibacter flavus]|uniref:DinB family protein n=1 Tax=Danxiaibacter flavus TaxID=3049108 RepID=A0ABV3ZMQ3_9BACT|nr:DinB family protein [Chitinophagaceae bacterium DXS]
MSRIKDEMFITFNDVMKWFNAGDAMMQYRPANGGWTIAEVLEHITLTNFYLLLLIRKAALKSLQHSMENDYRDMLQSYEFDWEKMQVVSNRDAADWTTPEQMIPSGTVAAGDIKATLRRQLVECLGLLDDLKKGEGVLQTTMMNVYGLGKIDVYQHIYFLVQHTKRHIGQMRAIRNEFEENNLATQRFTHDRNPLSIVA